MPRILDTLALQHCFDFDDELTVGLHVEVRWTNTGAAYRGAAWVEKLNGKSLRARLLFPVVTDGQPYPAQSTIVVPRCGCRGWSPHNGAFPLREGRA